MQTSTPLPPAAGPPSPRLPRLQIGRRIGVPVTTGDVTLTYESFVVELRLGPAGYVWNWPIGVSVARGQGVTRQAVVDVTRLVIWTCWAITLAAAMLTMIAALRNRQNVRNLQKR